MIFRPRVLVLGLLALFAFQFGRGATTTLAEGYSLRVWQTQDGLPQNMVTSAVQTRDGYLWFGTYSGLARFDGDRFQVFNSINTPGLADRRIARLFEDADGDLWIGHEAGSVTRYRDGRFEQFPVPGGSESERIIGLGSDREGSMWAMRENGALDAFETGNRLPSLIPPEKPGIMAWSRSRPGDIWVAENGRAAQVVDGKLVPVPLDPIQPENFVIGLAADEDGGAWLLCDNRIRKWKDGRWLEDLGAYPWPAGSLSCCLQLRDGSLAIGTIFSGVYLVFRDGRPPVHFDQNNGLPQNWVRFLHEDREGNLWVGAGSAGLVSIRATAFSVLNSPDHWRGCSVLSVAPGQGDSLWIGTDGAALYHYSSGDWKHYADAEGVTNWYISAVTETPLGEVWLGYYWWGGPHHLQNDRFVRPPQVDETSSPVLALVGLPASNDLLVGNRDGLLRLSANGSTWLIKSPEGSADDVCAVARDEAGVIWCGFAQGGLARLENGVSTLYRRKDGLGSDSVQCLLADDDGALWIGTADNGLTRFKQGKFVNLGTAQGLADDIVCHLLDDGLGYFWLATHHGIQRIAKADLNRCADGALSVVASQVYDRNDGLPVVEFLGGRQAAGCKTSDGRLWFASSKGLVSINPARIETNPLPPPVVVESLLVDGRATQVENGSLSHRLSPDHQHLQFRFSGLSYVAPSKVRFKYQLEGFDEDWSEASPTRTAFYSRLHAGTYTFRVLACNNDGLWNPQPAVLTFTIAPFFWETWWFVGASSVAAVLMVGTLARYFTRRRMQRRIAQMEREHEMERERARIAQDIHDDVGASLSRIAMLSQPARRDLAEPERSAALLARIYATAREVTRSLDEIVWAIDPRHDTLDSLVDYMGRFAQEYLTAAGLRCRLDLPVAVPAWPLNAEIRHNLFLAFKEALHNAVKHAAATQVRISLRLQPASFQLVVQDNGRGFDPGESTQGGNGRRVPGNGLVNLQTRLTRIGGDCEILSAVGEGTTVSLNVGLAPAQLVPPPSPPPTL